MFRQVILQRWAANATAKSKAGLVAALHRLSEIPEVVSAWGGVDAGLFADNWDLVSVLDFADVDSARRYVAHPEHQAFISEHVRPMTGERAVVQAQWGQDAIVGYHHVKLPVTDVDASRAWYTTVCGFEPDLEFMEDGQLRGVALIHRVAGIRLALRHDPDRASAMAGFDIVALAVGTLADLEAVIARAQEAGGRAHPVREGREGWTSDLIDPDGMVVRLYTHQRHS
jgi:catechol 2,3-dioxygenase-like lactoylglutathione lyase family enzyme